MISREAKPHFFHDIFRWVCYTPPTFFPPVPGVPLNLDALEPHKGHKPVSGFPWRTLLTTAVTCVADISTGHLLPAGFNHEDEFSSPLAAASLEALLSFFTVSLFCGFFI